MQLGPDEFIDFPLYCTVNIHCLCPSDFISQNDCVAYLISSLAETRDRVLSYFSGEVNFTRWFPIAFLINGVFIVTRAGFEFTTPYVMSPQT